MGNVASRDGGRIDMVDALRGTALIGLFLVHMDEHFELLRYPTNAPDWLNSLNQWVHHLTFGLFAGKAYAIFAMMFGISFTLILQSWAKKDGDAAARLEHVQARVVHAGLHVQDAEQGMEQVVVRHGLARAAAKARHVQLGALRKRR